MSFNRGKTKDKRRGIAGGYGEIERLRAQAERCWKLAILIADQAAAKTLIFLAAKYLEQAEKLESESEKASFLNPD